ncbi:Gfo/Idh/MocA family protein [Roseibium litorale]|uniref:Gfo/Idh/MocA family oxidoreductase n=1 Tax=Roseibium litorale TaxID=2803841 RepID=A0ABR9CIH8_9HYPH|nr:Gfo/Idh/MocA family oxidoreductase [Roseibium litorale]MBD8890630.1 Gfo/Idh/MocA family oxidoreductase [Roseibium litorale]
MGEAVRIAVAGAGMIGRKHISAIAQTGGAARLAAIADPGDVAKAYAAELGVPWYPGISELIEADRPDGLVIATPNQAHVANGLQAVEAGIPALVEKPVAVGSDEGERLVMAGELAGVPLLAGHHRRYNPLIEKAKTLIGEGRFGQVVSVNVMGWLFKPEDYFAPDWRRQPGAGPVYTNLIHDIDLMQHLCGPVEKVSCFSSRRIRGHAVEDSAVVSFVFESGALGTANISDTAVAPWSWELTARENPAYPPTGEACYLIGGTHGSLELPALKLWHQGQARGWWEPIDASQQAYSFEDPLVRQMRHFAGVIRGEEAPRVTARDGLQALKVIEAILQSAREERPVIIRSS